MSLNRDLIHGTFSLGLLHRRYPRTLHCHHHTSKSPCPLPWPMQWPPNSSSQQFPCPLPIYSPQSCQSDILRMNGVVLLSDLKLSEASHCPCLQSLNTVPRAPSAAQALPQPRPSPHYPPSSYPTPHALRQLRAFVCSVPSSWRAHPLGL